MHLAFLVKKKKKGSGRLSLPKKKSFSGFHSEINAAGKTLRATSGICFLNSESIFITAITVAIHINHVDIIRIMKIGMITLMGR